MTFDSLSDLDDVERETLSRVLVDVAASRQTFAVCGGLLDLCTQLGVPTTELRGVTSVDTSAPGSAVAMCCACSQVLAELDSIGRLVGRFVHRVAFAVRNGLMELCAQYSCVPAVTAIAERIKQRLGDNEARMAASFVDVLQAMQTNHEQAFTWLKHGKLGGGPTFTAASQLCDYLAQIAFCSAAFGVVSTATQPIKALLDSAGSLRLLRQAPFYTIGGQLPVNMAAGVVMEGPAARLCCDDEFAVAAAMQICDDFASGSPALCKDIAFVRSVLEHAHRRAQAARVGFDPEATVELEPNQQAVRSSWCAVWKDASATEDAPAQLYEPVGMKQEGSSQGCMARAVGRGGATYVLWLLSNCGGAHRLLPETCVMLSAVPRFCGRYMAKLGFPAKNFDLHESITSGERGEHLSTLDAVMEKVAADFYAAVGNGLCVRLFSWMPL